MNLTFLREAIRLSIDQLDANEGGPFGAVIVRDGEIVGRGWNRVTAANDPTAHAEIVAIRDACATINSFSLSGCELYSSCEPCPMCLAAIYWSRLDSLTFAATRDDAADAGFDDALIYGELAKPVEVRSLPTTQTLRDEACVAFQKWKTHAGRTAY